MKIQENGPRARRCRAAGRSIRRKGFAEQMNSKPAVKELKVDSRPGQ